MQNISRYLLTEQLRRRPATQKRDLKLNATILQTSKKTSKRSWLRDSSFSIKIPKMLNQNCKHKASLRNPQTQFSKSKEQIISLYLRQFLLEHSNTKEVVVSFSDI